MSRPDPAADRAEVERLKALRANQDANSDWMAAHLAALEPEPVVQADPRVVHQLPVAAADLQDSRQIAWEMYSAQQEKMSPEMKAFAEERKTAIKTGGLHGQSGYSDRPGGNPSPWRAR
jgi:hypothetical protein